MDAYIARSALVTLLLDAAQRSEPETAGLWLEFAPADATGCNWRVSRCDLGAANEAAASSAIDDAVRKYKAWVMVDDGDPRDGKELQGPG